MIDESKPGGVAVAGVVLIVLICVACAAAAVLIGALRGAQQWTAVGATA